MKKKEEKEDIQKDREKDGDRKRERKREREIASLAKENNRIAPSRKRVLSTVTINFAHTWMKQKLTFKNLTIFYFSRMKEIQGPRSPSLCVSFSVQGCRRRVSTTFR